VALAGDAGGRGTTDGRAQPRRARVAGLVLLVLALALVAAVYGPHLGHSTDDAFITYRYARNLAGGEGLVFNPGERHLATTAPGWAVALAGIARLAGPAAIPVASGLLSLVALLGAVWLLSRRLVPDGSALFLATCIPLAGNRWLVEVLGHEEFAQALLVVAALELLERLRPRAAGLVWGVAIFVRPDSAVLGAAAGLDEWRRRRRLPLSLLVAAVATAALGLAVVWALSGSALPASLRVKLAAASAPALAVVPPYWPRLAQWCWRCWGWSGPPLFALSAAGWAWLVRHRRPEAVRMLVPGLVAFLFYPLLGVNFAPWYLVLPLLLATVGAGAALVVAWRRRLLALRLAALVLAGLAVVAPLRWAVASAAVPPDPRTYDMRAAGRWIEAHSAPGDVVATVEVGLLGFACERPMLDLVGLCSPGVLSSAVRGQLPDLVLARQPAFLVYNNTFSYLLGPLFDDPRFLARYRMEWRRPPPPGSRTEVQVWRRGRPTVGDERVEGAD